MNDSVLASGGPADRSYHITHALGDQAQYTFQGISRAHPLAVRYTYVSV